MKQTTLVQPATHALSKASPWLAALPVFFRGLRWRNARQSTGPALRQPRKAGLPVDYQVNSSSSYKITTGHGLRGAILLLLLLLGNKSLLYAQDNYQALYKEVESISTPSNPSFKIGGLTLTSIDVLNPKPGELDQNGFYGFGLVTLNPPPQKSFSALIKVYASKYEYKDYADLTPIKDLFPLAQTQYAYKLEFFPSGTVSYQFLVNGKPFLNRPPTVSKAISYQKGYVQVDKLLMFLKVGFSLPTPPVKKIAIHCEPIVSFANLRKTPNASNGTNLLAFGVNTVATVYRVQRVENKGSSSIVLSYPKFRSLANTTMAAYYGSGSSATITSLVNSYHPNYFVNKAATIPIPAGQTIELPGEVRIVVIHSTTTPATPVNLFYDQPSVECNLIQNKYFEHLPVMDIQRFANFM